MLIVGFASGRIPELGVNMPLIKSYDVLGANWSTTAWHRPDISNKVMNDIFDLFEQEDGLDALFGLIRENLPERLYETGYALACDVAAADGTLAETELRLLEEMRYELNIDRLHAAAIERGARARHVT